MKIKAIGGYSEVGRNMTLVECKGEAVLCDMGVQLEPYINLSDQDYATEEEMLGVDAIPDMSLVEDEVVAIIPSHAHLDHVGAIPYLAGKYDCPIIGTPYTISVIKALLKDKEAHIPNELITVNVGGKHQISDKFTVEFVKVTHSTPDSAMIVLHTPHGQVVYANDFKLDPTPVLGKPTDYARLKELGDAGNIKALVMDSLCAGRPGKTPSEQNVQNELQELLSGLDADAIFVTTFSSHIERLKSIVEYGRMIGREVIMLGRSLAKYVYAAYDVHIIEYDADIYGHKGQIARMLGEVEKDPTKYLVLCTGHQGEPNAMLSKIADGLFGFRFQEGDAIIFSCKTIPTELNRENRAVLEDKLKNLNVQVFKDIHVSGHASEEDHKELISYLRPEIIIPSHAAPEQTKKIMPAAKSQGYSEDEVHIFENGDEIEL